ncbi:unnamed protein product [Phytophthora fragariaefolia]|uniref:Unnamed protein product n=1 Tax=Phytophthora fragariaefolia TaxID=1490495 RepID=A0A9W6Y4N3_9STRA|nr:unnamed protein product [Phytophthora fragariaefolia]
MLRKGWVAAYATFYAYLPDLDFNTTRSFTNYSVAIKDAVVSSRCRAGEVLRIVRFVVRLLLALAFYAPMVVYEFVEFVLLGKAGVALALLMMNLVNCYFEWAALGVAASEVFVTIGIVTHIWRSGKGESDWKRFSPTATIVEGPLMDHPFLSFPVAHRCRSDACCFRTSSIALNVGHSNSGSSSSLSCCGRDRWVCTSSVTEFEARTLLRLRRLGGGSISIDSSGARLF